ncbi:alpha-galactosidase [Arthrobacter sp. CAN_A1]|uniref:alpha-galactosidase n=1 Tax=Arthrobacter sp. CAN_A1 TaxID=2787717 RepID=UPI0018CA8747
MHSSTIFHLTNGGTSVVVDSTTAGLPAILYWGSALEETGSLDDFAAVSRPQRVSGGLDSPPRLTLVPQESFGWQGTPGITGHRDGGAHFARFATTTISASGTEFRFTAEDPHSGLGLEGSLVLTDAGLFRQRVQLTNVGDTPYEVSSILAVFPVPSTAGEILDTTGRHLRERSPQRHTLTTGTYRRESRRGRPGLDATLLLAAGEAAFGFESGMVHAVHSAWSGNHQLLVERTPSGETFIAAGELLLSQEIVLQPGDSYAAPDALGSWGNGLNELSQRFHQEQRSRPSHPQRDRPVTLNTWEAVYFDHNLQRLTQLADRAAAVGIERFVLDDGWFKGRRDDTAGLGDWFVDDNVWPDGLAPIIDHVRTLGMEFGLWFEPEMVNPDSDLARLHPDWILQADGRLPPSARQQQALNLAIPEAWEYLLDRMDSILSGHDIAYIKWDHNRDLVEAAGAISGVPEVHRNVTALYRLLDELKRRHPGLEIESCASGGGRVDLEILARTDRIWTSDCIDPLERLVIQKYTGLLVAPELMGMHIGGPVSHSTHRAHSLPLRASTAVFGHYGVEWDISELEEQESADLAAWIAVHKEWRSLLHSGRVVHADQPDPAMDVRGTVAGDGSAALYAYTLTASSASYPPGRIRFPGLDPTALYTIAPAAAALNHPGAGQSPLDWYQAALRGTPAVLSGRLLGSVGVQAPVLFPEQSILIEVRRTSARKDPS